VAKPFLKWVGGKGKLIPELRKRMPEKFGCYFEPFLGGGALFFDVRPPQAILSDVNAHLINCYAEVQRNVQRVIAQLEKHREKHSDIYYEAVRNTWNNAREAMTPTETAALFIYLNKTCYNGLWRENQRGQFNTPAGRYVNPSILDVDRLQEASAALQGAWIGAWSFEAIIEWARPGDFIYFDPPYIPQSDTANFTAYSKSAFGMREQQALAGVFDALDGLGCHLMLSNSDTEAARSLYSRWTIDSVLAPRSVNCQKEGRGLVGEIIVTNRR
jgi:DNA adenine methylase